jgi:peptide/nickel transport system permease protein
MYFKGGADLKKLAKRIRRQYNVTLVSGAILLAVVIVLVIGAPLFAGYNPVEQSATDRLQAPGFSHLFGTDRFGRDVFARTLFGGRTTLVSAFAALLATITVGIAVGTVSGMFYGKLIDTVCMRIVDVLMAYPFMVLAMVIAGLFGVGFSKLLFAVIIVGWVPFARLTRSIVIREKNDTAVSAAIVLGASSVRIVFRELLPKIIGPVFVQATFELGTLILSISALSFLGLGAQPPTPEWGSMLADGRPHFITAPHILMGPALFVISTVLGLNLIGEGLRDRLDPYEIVSI